MTTYRAGYQSGDVRIETRRGYRTREAAWSALGRALERHGIERGPWHMPGAVAGDVHEAGRACNYAARANGGAWIQEADAS